MSFERGICSHVIWPHRIAASPGNRSLHPSVIAVYVIPSHLNSSHVFSAFSPHLISSHLMFSLPSSALLSWSQLFSSHLMSSELFSSFLSTSARSQPALLWYFALVHLMSKLVLALIWLFSSTCHSISFPSQRDTAAAFSMRTTRKVQRRCKRGLQRRTQSGSWLRGPQRHNWENLLTNHYRSLDAATPIRFTMPSCKRQLY